MKRFLKSVIRKLRNKYLLSFTVFIIWLMFFDQDNMIERYKAVNQLDRLHADKKYYLDKIQTDSLRLEELRSDPENLEKFAREQYLMKKDDEDIFLVK